MILEASARVLASDGYERAGVNRIAARAGVSVGSLYQYFPTKESILLAVAKRHADRMIELFERGLPELAFLPMPDAVRGVVRLTLAAYAIDPPLVRELKREEPKLVSLARRAEFDQLLRTIFLGYCTAHADELRVTNLELAVTVLSGAVEAAIVAVLERGAFEEDEIVDEIGALVLGYLMKSP